MKNINIKNLALFGAMMVLASCSENSWNDRLDGFEVPPVFDESLDVTYTLTATDYSTIAASSANQALATTEAEKEALNAIGTNKYFETPEQAQKYIPALLSSPTFPYYVADNGSSILISYALPNAGNATVEAINTDTQEYKVTDADYMAAWGSEEDYINGFAPMLPAASHIPNILKSAYPDAEEGSYVVVNYNESTTNPIFGGVPDGEVPEVKLTDAIKNLAVGDNLNATAVVTAQCSRGLILTDNAGSILYYNNDLNLGEYPLGTIVKVSGEISAYNHGLQLSNSAAMETVGAETYTYPNATAYTAAMVDEACATEGDFLATYVSIEGALNIDGNYYNIIIDGAEAQGSVYYATDDLKEKMTNGTTYTFYGYFMAVSGSGKFFNILVTDVREPGGDAPDTVGVTDNIKDLSVGDNLTATAIVTGQCARGLILTDNGGSILYYNTDVDLDKYPVGTIVNVSGEVSAYNQGLQLSGSAEIEVTGSENYVYPSPTVYTAAMVDEACAKEGNILATFVAITGELNIDGNYYNILIDGATSQGSVYYATDAIKKDLTSGKSYTFYGYFIAISGSGKYFNILVTDAVPAGEASRLPMKAPLGTTATVSKNAIYMFDGGKWVIPANTVVLQPEDYSVMDQSYGNLSNNLPETLLPTYLAINYPYASEDDIMIVVYKYYDGSGTSYQCSQFVNDGMAWTGWKDENMASDRFSKNNDIWIWNPSVSITLPYIRNDATSVTFYQACVDWVYENIDVPYFGSESISDGKGFVTTYGNNEYYTGASAYYCNVDLRPASARNQCSKGFGDFPGYGEMSDDEVIESMKEHFDYEVVPAVLANLYPNATPIEGVTINYSVTFTAYYTNGTEIVTGVWEVVGPAIFEFSESSWYK